MISIIVPVFNSEKWLKRCVESLINQTYKNIEIILINDGSTDNSLEICKEYAFKDRRIVVIDKPNGGVSTARNIGIKSAKGEYVQFVDSDDYIDEFMCEKLLNAIENSDMVLCGLKVWQNGKLLREPHLQDGHVKLREKTDNYFKLRKINLGPCNKLYRKEKITNLFNENLSLGEDTLFVFDYMKNIDKICVLSDCLYNVVLDNENSLNRQKNLQKYDSLIEQRKLEEKLLVDIYGENCDLTEMYNCYLLLLHAMFLELVKSSGSIFKEYVSSDFLQMRIKNSKPNRFDYKIFKFIFTHKLYLLNYLFFFTKNLLINLH